MALLEEQFTEKLETGAPDITYEGEEGREQQIAQALWDRLPTQMRMQFGSFSQFFSSGAWKKVLAALQQQMQQQPTEEIQETTEVMQPAAQQGLGSLMQGPRTMAHGGIAGPDGRKAYGLGSFFKSITKPIKKAVKSPLGKAAIAYGLGTYLGGMPAFGGEGGTFMSRLKNPGAMMNLFKPSQWSAGNILNPLVRKGIEGGGYGGASLWKLAGLGATAAPLVMGAMGKWDKGPKEFDIKGGKFGFNYEQMIRDIQNAETEEEYLAVLAQYNLSPSDLPPWSSQKRAQGGRIGAQEGGLMDLGGMEKDYRNDGGFVPLGEEEKADDVPARLSKNEFVFTADAVRAAGGGDIDQGAEIMENVMKNLERGGEISEESQGLGGARDMFEVSERLSEVV